MNPDEYAEIFRLGCERARRDLRRLLESCSEDEIAGLRVAIAEGQIEGHVYWDEVARCGCVFGTVAYLRLLRGLKGCGRVPGPIEIRQVAMDMVVEFGTNDIEGFAEPIHVDVMPDPAADPRSGAYRAGMLMRWIDEWAAERGAVA